MKKRYAAASFFLAGMLCLTAGGLTACSGIPLPAATEPETTAAVTAGGSGKESLTAGIQAPDGEDLPSASGSAAEETTPEQTTPEQTTTAPETTEGSAGLVGYGAAYADVLTSWDEAYRKLLAGDASGFEESSLFSFNYELSNRQGKSDRSDTPEAALTDLNGDGVPELLVSVFSSDDGLDTLFDVFTYSGGAVRITPSALALELLGDGTVVARSGKGSADFDFYRYEGGSEMTRFDSYSYSYGGEGEERTWFHVDPETGEWIEISEEEYQQARDSHGEPAFAVFPVTEENLEQLRKEAMAF